MYIVIVCAPVCDIMNFEIYFSFSYQPVFLHNQKSQNKSVNILRTKIAFKMIQESIIHHF